MAYLAYNNVKIAGISAVVPKTVINNSDYTDFMSKTETESVIKMTGIKERRFAGPEVCSSDLCYKAALLLLDHLGMKRNAIDVIIMVTLTPDYRMPATAFLLHDRLGLKNGCLAFDISLGCSGYIYGLAMAYNLLLQESINNVLLLNGETKSKTYGKRDKSTSLLFGDAGTATILTKTSLACNTCITLNSDGSRHPAIIIPAGGYRNPTSADTIIEKRQADGNWRSQEQGCMDGPAVFDFTITEVPKDINNILAQFQLNIEDISYFVFHQANRFITEHIRKKIRIPAEKVLYSIGKYGNTASVSIPLTICSELGWQNFDQKVIVCLTAFGVGLSWGSVITDLRDCQVLPVAEY
jgi:3-oxoacyl-[acyl-carrier-protein] synthase III